MRTAAAATATRPERFINPPCCLGPDRLDFRRIMISGRPLQDQDKREATEMRAINPQRAGLKPARSENSRSWPPALAGREDRAMSALHRKGARYSVVRSHGEG